MWSRLLEKIANRWQLPGEDTKCYNRNKICILVSLWHKCSGCKHYFGLDVRFAPWNGICSWRLNWSKSMVKKVTVLMKEFTTDTVKNCLLGNFVCLQTWVQRLTLIRTLFALYSSQSKDSQMAKVPRTTDYVFWAIVGNLYCFYWGWGNGRRGDVTVWGKSEVQWTLSPRKHMTPAIMST